MIKQKSFFLLIALFSSFFVSCFFDITKNQNSVSASSKRNLIVNFGNKLENIPLSELPDHFNSNVSVSILDTDLNLEFTILSKNSTKFMGKNIVINKTGNLVVIEGAHDCIAKYKIEIIKPGIANLREQLLPQIKTIKAGVDKIINSASLDSIVIDIPITEYPVENFLVKLNYVSGAYSEFKSKGNRLEIGTINKEDKLISCDIVLIEYFAEYGRAENTLFSWEIEKTNTKDKKRAFTEGKVFGEAESSLISKFDNELSEKDVDEILALFEINLEEFKTIEEKNAVLGEILFNLAVANGWKLEDCTDLLEDGSFAHIQDYNSLKKLLQDNKKHLLSCAGHKYKEEFFEESRILKSLLFLSKLECKEASNYKFLSFKLSEKSPVIDYYAELKQLEEVYPYKDFEADFIKSFLYTEILKNSFTENGQSLVYQNIGVLKEWLLIFLDSLNKEEYIVSKNWKYEKMYKLRKVFSWIQKEDKIVLAGYLTQIVASLHHCPDHKSNMIEAWYSSLDARNKDLSDIGSLQRKYFNLEWISDEKHKKIIIALGIIKRKILEELVNDYVKQPKFSEEKESPKASLWDKTCEKFGLAKKGCRHTMDWYFNGYKLIDESHFLKKMKLENIFEELKKEMGAELIQEIAALDFCNIKTDQVCLGLLLKYEYCTVK